MDIWFTGIAPRGNMFACEYIDQVLIHHHISLPISRYCRHASPSSMQDVWHMDLV